MMKTQTTHRSLRQRIERNGGIVRRDLEVGEVGDVEHNLGKRDIDEAKRNRRELSVWIRMNHELHALFIRIQFLRPFTGKLDALLSACILKFNARDNDSL